MQRWTRTVGKIGMAAALVAACGGSDGSGSSGDDPLPLADALTAFDSAVIELAALDDGALDNAPCPFDAQAAVNAVFGGISLDPPLSVTTGEREVFETVSAFDDPPRTITCDVETSFDSVGVLVSEPLGTDYESFMNEIYGDADDGVVELRAAGSASGGALFEFCADFPEDNPNGDLDYCEVSWVSDEMNIAFYVSGDEGPMMSLSEVREGLVEYLPTLVDDIATS